MKRVKFGINGLDGALHGGLEPGSSTLISGGPGVGKTSIGLSFLYNGALSGEPGIFVTLEEAKGKIVETAKNLGMARFPELLKSGKLALMGFEDFRGTEVDLAMADDILAIAGKCGAKRVVVDTLTTLALYATSPRWKVAATQPTPKLVLYQPSKANIKQFVVNFISRVHRIDNVTTLFLAEKHDEFTIAQEYICDSVIEMERPSYEATREGAVLLRVLKTRRSGHSDAVHVVKIASRKGVEVIPAEEALKV